MMDRALKERIIGAVVLVAVVVLVVPVFLDGPPAEDETLTERMPLPGQSDQKTQTVVLNRDRDAPVPSPAPEIDAARGADMTAPAAERAERDTPAPTPAVVEEDQRVAQAARQEAPTAQGPSSTPPPAASSTGMWAVQLGSFSEQANAEKLAAGLRKQGFAAFLSQVNVETGQLHRVRIGPQKDREAAEAMAARLAAAGHSGQVVPHP